MPTMPLQLQATEEARPACLSLACAPSGCWHASPNPAIEARELRLRQDHMSPEAIGSQNHVFLEPAIERLSAESSARRTRGECVAAFSSMRYRGAMTPPARSTDNLPVICKNRKNARSELHLSVTVRFERRAERSSTNASTSARVARSMGLAWRRSCPRKPPAVSTSRTSVRSETPIVGSPVMAVFIQQW